MQEEMLQHERDRIAQANRERFMAGIGMAEAELDLDTEDRKMTQVGSATLLNFYAICLRDLPRSIGRQ